jgi:hypothetical protein
MRRRPGWIALDDIELEGGVVVRVQLDKEKGVFHARYEEVHKGEDCEYHSGKTWEGKDLEKIRADVSEWHRAMNQLKWEPVIVIQECGHSNQKAVLDQGFTRMMRARKMNGKGYEWRYWPVTKPEEKEEGGQRIGSGSFVNDHDLDVYPPGAMSSEPFTTRSDETPPVILEYTPERWTALLTLVEMEKALHARFREIVEHGAEEVGKLLTRIPSVGLLAFTEKRDE